MSEPATARHGLEPLLAEFGGQGAAHAGVRITVRDDVAHINLRGDADDEHFVRAVQQVLDQPLPRTPNTLTRAAHTLYWLGPDEWQLVTGADTATDIAARLDEATAGMHVAINDISGGQVALRLAGDDVRQVLAKGCTLDLHPQAFPAGACAQSALAKAIVLIGCIDDPPAFDVIVRRSFSDYLCRWLWHSGREFGVRIGSS